MRALAQAGATSYLSATRNQDPSGQDLAMRDLMGIMKQAQAMQERMAGLQAELDTVEVEGSSGGGMVRATMTAKGLLKALRIDPSLMQADEREILEDLVVAAVNDARGKAEAEAQARMAELTKGLPLPPGMKLPF